MEISILGYLHAEYGGRPAFSLYFKVRFAIIIYLLER